MLKKYKFGFDISGLVLFLIVMFPDFIWFAVPAPNDVLRSNSVTPIIDAIGSICQVLFIAALCIIINKERKNCIYHRYSYLLLFASFCIL